MKKITVEGYLSFLPSEYHKEGGSFSIDTIDMSSIGYVIIQKISLDFEVPDFDPRELLVQKLQKERQAIIDEATRKASALEEKIQQLLALPQEHV